MALFCIVIQLIMIISGITIQILDVTQLTFIYFLSLAYVESRKAFEPKEENKWKTKNLKMKDQIC